jgi:hypothetical protein
MVSLLMQRGEINLASFPCGDVPGMKLRPVLLLIHPIGSATEVLVAYISSVVPLALLPSDIVIAVPLQTGDHSHGECPSLSGNGRRSDRESSEHKIQDTVEPLKMKST